MGECVCAKSLQLCLTLCDPEDYSSPGSSVHGILQVKNIGVDCHALLPRIFLTKWLYQHLLCILQWQEVSLPLASSGKPIMCRLSAKSLICNDLIQSTQELLTKVIMIQLKALRLYAINNWSSTLLTEDAKFQSVLLQSKISTQTKKLPIF